MDKWRDVTITYYEDEDQVQYVAPRRAYLAIIAALVAVNILAGLIIGGVL